MPQHYVYDLFWRTFIHNTGIGDCLPAGSLDDIGHKLWPGLGIGGDPRRVTVDQLRAIDESGFPVVPLKRVPSPADPAAVAELHRVFCRYSEVGFTVVANEGFIVNLPMFNPPFGPAPATVTGIRFEVTDAAGAAGSAV